MLTRDMPPNSSSSGGTHTVSSIHGATSWSVGVSLAPTLGVVLVAQVARRSTNFALARPAREVLYTGVDRVSRFKGKNVVDTVVYRGGDMIGGWAFAGLEAAGVGLSAIAWLATPVVGVWAWLGFQLGRGPPAVEGSTDTAALH